MTLDAALERPLPPSLPVGRGTALFCAGTCFSGANRLLALEVVLDGEHYPVSAFGMQRPDVARSHGSNGGGPAARSGFWATVPMAARPTTGAVKLGLAAEVEGGEVWRAEVGEIEIVAVPPAPAARAAAARPAPGLIAVCMATFEPDMELFRAQLHSLREQEDQNWICLISDDCSSEERFAEIQAEVDGDARFEVSRSEQRLGFYRNFERALGMVPQDAELIALCDQDDRWHPDKLSALRGEIGAAVLVYSDLRLVEADGRVLRETLWRGRSNNHTNLASMLIANSITGAATLFRRDLLEVLLPFPDTPGFQFHDHWLAVAALAAGDVAYVPRPLYDYVQHRGAVFGHVTHGERADTIPKRRGRALESLRAVPLRWRAAYFYGYLAREVQARALLVRCADRLTPGKRRALEWFIGAERSWGALLWLALRPLRLLIGRTETLASELELLRGVIWKRVAHWTSRTRLPLLPALDAGPAPLDAFNPKRLRRWRASI